ncbi:ParB-like chromosome segregation protein Spo0J [Loktanella ponticola]|uniref:ParB-like chromosome segregation protein Spo0J n=1 Tax=Yoonia ponticola TaxID=1524255 RepID=A0A7W9F0V5_9RHOB|nr:ParB N-terminal domain-containing protein [Yoonia ponticola]MBB5723640.1 ParB-like chromosome segregation protein Spo0J [Yoonia ponticola]
MAKRKRLTPAVITDAPALETKSAIPRYPLGVAPKTRAPIADVAQDASASAALTEIAQTLTDARNEGRLIQRIPLELVSDEYLVRDRIDVDDDEMITLLDSLRDRGQQTAIEVTAIDHGRYGLISGWRRMQALRHLEVPDVLAIVRTPADSAESYLAMVEENEIRVGLTYYERARIVAKAVDQGIYRTDRVGLVTLFHAASRPKRSKIGSFVGIVRALDDHLRFPTAITERSGLALAAALEADVTLADKIASEINANSPKTADAEAAIIAAFLQPATTPPAAKAPAPALGGDSLTEAPRELGQGLRYKRTAKGEIVLSGPRLDDADFRQKLQDFLTAL